MATTLIVFSLMLTFAAFGRHFPATIKLTKDEVQQARRELLPYHLAVTIGTLLLVVALLILGERLASSGLVPEGVAAGYGLVLLLLTVNGGLALLARVKGEEWMSYYGGFASHQYGFDYFKVWRFLSIAGVVIGFYVAVRFAL